MFFVVESYVEVNEDGTESGYSLPIHTKQNQNDAESTYHSILAAAAISNHRYHGAIIYDEKMFPIMHKSYEHIPEEA